MSRSLPLAMAIALVACGGDSSTSPTPPTPTPDPGPARADLGMSLETGQLCLSPIPGFLLRTTVPLTIRENAGLQARANFFRLSLFLDGVEIERAENGADDIIADLEQALANVE